MFADDLSLLGKYLKSTRSEIIVPTATVDMGVDAWSRTRGVRSCRRHRASRRRWPSPGCYHNIAEEMSHSAMTRRLSRARVLTWIDMRELARAPSCILSAAKSDHSTWCSCALFKVPELTVARCEFSRVRFTGSYRGPGSKSRRVLECGFDEGVVDPVNERALVWVGRMPMAIMTAAVSGRRRQTYAQRMRSDASWILPRPKDVRRRARRTEVILGSVRLVTAEASYAGER